MPHVALPELAPSLAVSGFGGALIFVSLFRLVLADVPVHLAGIGGGAMVTLQQAGYALGIATLGSLFLSMGSHHISSGFGWVVGIEAAVAVFIAAGSFLLPRIAGPGENLPLENVALEV